MSKTRAQLRQDVDVCFHPIPAKFDTSLFQKAYSSIEGLPICIFDIIHTFISHKDYRELMNCNLATFQPIKYETVYYNLIGPERWLERDSVSNHMKDAFLMNIINSVKDKSKQIGLTMRLEHLISIADCCRLFKGINNVYINGKGVSVKGTLDFNMFNNIREVTLQAWRVKTITEGFENVVKLEIRGFRFLQSIKSINQRSALRTLLVSDCSNLMEVDINLNQVAELKLVGCGTLTTLRQLGGQNRIVLGFKGTLSNEILQGISLSIPNLEYVEIICSFPQPCDLKMLLDIPSLSLHNCNDRITFPPAFRGKHLKLINFNLSERNRSSSNFSSLQTLMLFDCESLVHFPVDMPLLVHLEISYCYQLKSIPSLNNLRVLRLIQCPQLKAIAPIQPSLQSLTLHGCHRITDIAPFKNIGFLEISLCDGITSVACLSGSSLEEDRRRIILYGLKNVNDLSALSNINHLELCSLPPLTSPQGIHNIRHLSFDQCSFEDLQGMSNIRSLELKSRCTFSSLTGIEGIPSVCIYSESLLLSTNYDGLRNHEVVKIYNRNCYVIWDIRRRQRELNIQTLIKLDCDGNQRPNNSNI